MRPSRPARTPWERARAVALALLAAAAIAALGLLLASAVIAIIIFVVLGVLLLAVLAVIEHLPPRSFSPGDRVLVLMGLEWEPGIVKRLWGRPGEQATAKVTLVRTGGKLDVDVPVGALEFEGGLGTKLRRLLAKPSYPPAR